MAKIKQEKDALSALLASTGAMSNNNDIAKSNDIIETVEPEPLFTFDKDDELKKIRKKCRNTVKEIAKAVLPADILKTSAMIDKIEGDAMSMVNLHWQLRLSEIMQDAITNSIQKGNMSPRMIEVFTQLTDKISQLQKQVLATEVQMRKNYLDFKTDMIEKLQEDMSKQNHQQKISSGTQQLTGSYTGRGTLGLIERSQNAFKAKAKADAEDVDFTEK